MKGEVLHTNVKKESGLINPRTLNPMELDIFIPSLNLAFEHQVKCIVLFESLSYISKERHHYLNAEYSQVPLEAVRQQDEVKKQLAKEQGITLVTVPFWWDGRENRYVYLGTVSLLSPLSLFSLVATIKQQRIDLLQ